MPFSPEDIAAHHRKRDKCAVNHYLDFRERHPCNPAHRHLDSLAGHRDRTAAHLHRYAESEYRTTRRLRENLVRKCVEFERRGKPHVEVDEYAEQKTGYYLEQLHRFETASQHGNLCKHEHDVHEVGVLADCQRGHHILGTGERESQRHGGDDAAAEIAAHAERYAESHYVERNKQPDMLPDELDDFFAERNNCSI